MATFSSKTSCKKDEEKEAKSKRTPQDPNVINKVEKPN
jgi:hypothetical protein